MIMNVDETGCEDKAFCIDDAVFMFGLEIPELRDAVSHDADAGFAERLPSAVGDPRVEDDRWFAVRRGRRWCLRTKRAREKTKHKHCFRERRSPFAHQVFLCRDKHATKSFKRAPGPQCRGYGCERDTK